jgi:hypothetical protein
MKNAIEVSAIDQTAVLRVGLMWRFLLMDFLR